MYCFEGDEAGAGAEATSLTSCGIRFSLIRVMRRIWISGIGNEDLSTYIYAHTHIHTYTHAHTHTSILTIAAYAQDPRDTKVSVGKLS